MKILNQYTYKYSYPQKALSFAGNSNPIQPTQIEQNSAAKKEISAALEKFCKINSKTPFIDGNLPLSKLHKMLTDIWLFSNYIKNTPSLAESGIDFESLQEPLTDLLKSKIYIDLDFNSRKPALDKLVEFGEKKENKKTFEKLYESILGEIFINNDDPVENLNKLGLKEINKLYSSKELSPFAQKITYENLQRLFRYKKSSTLISKNMDKLETILKKTEYSFFKSSKIDIDLLIYPGDVNSLMKKLLDISKTIAKGESLSLKVNGYTGVSQIRKADKRKNENIAQALNFDKDMNVISKSKTIISTDTNGQKIADITVIDLKNNAKYKIQRRLLPKYKVWKLDNMTKTQFDENGNLLWKEILKQGKIEGVFDKIKIDANKNMYINCYTTKSQNGISITKNLVAPDGTTTKVFYKKSANEKKESFKYTITDKNNKILGQRHIETKHISRYSSEFTENGKTYLVRYSDNYIRIFDKQTKRTTKINLENILEKDSQSIKQVLKKLPATELLKLNKNINSLKQVKPQSSSYDMFGKALSSSIDLFTFEHELGHAKNKPVQSLNRLIQHNSLNPDFVKHKLTRDKKLKEIFEEEKSRYFNAFPKYITDLTSYFTEEKSYKRPLGNLDEAIAETNAIINSPTFTRWLEIRTHLLQENFPRTIAYLMHKL